MESRDINWEVVRNIAFGISLLRLTSEGEETPQIGELTSLANLQAVLEPSFRR